MPIFNFALPFHGTRTKVAAQHIKKLWGADAVWSSPLTRTIQTTLVALQGHPMLRKK